MNEKKFSIVKLDTTDCNKKGNLLYSSWSVTWEKLIEQYPDAQVEILNRVLADGNILEYFGKEKLGFFVLVKLTIPSMNNWSFTERLAIVDLKNSAIIEESNIDIRDICDTIQRCINKAIARVGIGLNVYQNDFSHIPTKEVNSADNTSISNSKTNQIKENNITLNELKEKLLKGDFDVNRKDMTNTVNGETKTWEAVSIAFLIKGYMKPQFYNLKWNDETKCREIKFTDTVAVAVIYAGEISQAISSSTIKDRIVEWANNYFKE